MGASIALSGVVGCSDFPEEKIVPYVNQPESVIPGKPTFYATVMPFGGYGHGVLVESHEGRPTKIEGNPDHPASLGATNVFMQASILDLYDPDRAKLIHYAGEPSSWGRFYESLLDRLSRAGGKGEGLRLLTRTITSPTFAAQIAELKQKYPAARWHVHDPTADAGCSARRGGAPGRAVYDFSKAKVILSLDADFLFSDAGSLASARQFADGRRRQPGTPAAQHSMNRLYVIESTFSLTGAMADHRRAAKPSQVLEIARAIAGRLGVESARGAAIPAGWEMWIDAVVNDLRGTESTANASALNPAAVVAAGDHQPAELQALTFEMNIALGSKAVRYIDAVEVQGAESIESLVDDMTLGNVSTLLILGGNPAYDAPADVPFLHELNRLSTQLDATGKPTFLTAHLGLHENETSFACQWSIPESHYLESWGDCRAFDGTASLIQPLILPLSGASRSIWEMMEAVLGRPDRSGYEAVRLFWQGALKKSAGDNGSKESQPASQPAEANTQEVSNFEKWWQQALRKGVIAGSAFPARSEPSVPNVQTDGDLSDRSADGWELAFRPDPAVWDGQFANNGWLAELPKPFTKLVWDNAALISPRSAGKLGLKDGRQVRITYQNRVLDVPVMIVPGIPDETLTLTLGYGRTRGGHVLIGDDNLPRGYNAYELRGGASGRFAPAAQVTIASMAVRHLVATRSHHAMADLPGLDPKAQETELSPHSIEHPGMPDEEIEVANRKLVRSGTLDDFRKDENWVTKLGGELEMREKGISSEFPGRKIHLTLYPTTAKEGGWDYSKGYQWAMSIDASSCIGCNACVIACQAENNIPVVGKEECSHEREMHWIRVDDWFGAQPGGSSTSALDDPQIIHMPVACQHCENAPCEVVCPVGATTHSVEGLNEMTYNRCVGTRYCSNNCPYKVRRFNFFLYADYADSTRALQYNPDVTVRSRGVMEKCTYCVQRINSKRIEIEKLTVNLEERARIIEAESPLKAKALRDGIPARQKELLAQLQTACQQACPTQAIVFGDKNDSSSAIAKLRDDALSYTLLADLTTQPRTSYMARLRNTNPKLL